MYKLPISKYKNAAPKLIKREQILNGITTNRLSNTIGSLINCSLKHITFALDSSSGGSVCTFRHDDLNKRPTFSNDGFCVTHAHSGPITDIQYNTFNQSVLATCGFDSQIQLWSVKDNENWASSFIKLDQIGSLPLNENRSDCIQWNPNVDNILVSTSLNTIYLWDVQHVSGHLTAIRSHNEAIQGISWKRDGSLICTTAKDKTMQIIDPRNMQIDQNLKIENAKTANKDSKVVWLGTSDCILSSVYTQSFQREVHLWDIRNPSSPVHEYSIDTGNNVLIPYYDYDTSVCFLIGKAETLVRYCEVLMTDQWNFTCNSAQQIDDQIKGVCMVPKFGLDLMKCELDRLLLLTRNSLYPLPYFVPRRSYYDFHSDVYPETYNVNEAGLNKSDWLSGINADPIKIPLNPNNQKKYFNINGADNNETSKPGRIELSTPILVAENKQTTPQTPSASVSTLISSMNKITSSNESANTPNLNPPTSSLKSTSQISITPVTTSAPEVTASSNSEPKPTTVLLRSTTNRQPVQFNVDADVASEKSSSNIINSNGHGHSNGKENTNELIGSNGSNTDRKSKVKSVYYQSKYKYINGKPSHKNEHITNIRNLSTMWPSECNGFQVNSRHAAFLLAGSSGQIGIVELNKPGRLPDTTINSIVNKSKVSDFQWDPFNEETLAVACDDGTIKIWKIPEEGIDRSFEEPDIELRGHLERLYCIKYHPYAKNVIASASYDRTIKIWNIESRQAVITLRGHTDVVFSISWSPCGNKIATICKDGFVRVYEPLVNEMPIVEAKVGPGPGSKAARIEWVLNGSCLLVSGFGRSNIRQIYLFDSEDLSLLQSEDINQSPSLLIPYYDPDIHVLYLYAKGEETVYLYEIQETDPYFQVLSPYKPEGLHFAIAFLPKLSCDIKSAEIAKTYRLTKDNRIEKISFTVPRVKLGYFQDDIYPDTIDRQTPYLSAQEWISGAKVNFVYISLQPNDMEKLTEMLAIEQANQTPKPVAKDLKKFSSIQPAGDLYNPENLNEDEKKIISSMLQRATLFYKEKSDDESENSDWN